jgi:hypothetical protein
VNVEGSFDVWLVRRTRPCKLLKNVVPLPVRFRSTSITHCVMINSDKNRATVTATALGVGGMVATFRFVIRSDTVVPTIGLHRYGGNRVRIG